MAHNNRSNQHKNNEMGATKIGRNKELYTRMEALRSSGAAGVHSDQNSRKNRRKNRRETRREERDATMK